MKRIIYAAFVFLSFLACTDQPKAPESNQSFKTTTTMTDTIPFKYGYSDVNGIKMYYEIYGQGKPLVLIHGGGSTIQTSFGRVIPQLAKHRQIIGVELQIHGRTSDREADLSFEQDADDIAALLNNLQIKNADFFGFSNGANTAMQMAIRYPLLTGKIIAGSPLCKRSGAFPQFWDFMNHATIDQMPQQYKDEYKKVAPDPNQLQTMHDRCVKRMVTFKDWSDEQIKSITVPTLLIFADKDVATPEHAVELYRLIPNCQLAILPGGHGEYIGEITTLTDSTKTEEFAVPMIEKFLNSETKKQ